MLGPLNDSITKSFDLTLIGPIFRLHGMPEIAGRGDYFEALFGIE
jgi:hypothetical protein